MNVTRRVALLSITASLLTLGLKLGAYGLTGSVSLLSDAAESLINLAASLIAFAALTVAQWPPDASHAYGHDKAEYFSSGAEGVLILGAAFSIFYAAIRRLLQPVALVHLGPGLAIALAASAINFGVSRRMLHIARRYDSIALEADAQHLMADVWTSLGIVVGLAVVMFNPRWRILDPLLAMLVGLNIVVTGVGLLKRSARGLMDYTLSPAEVTAIEAAIRETVGPHAAYHRLRTRRAGSRRFVDVHLLLPGQTTVQAAHDMCEAIEQAVRRRLPGLSLTVHVEPLEDRQSFHDEDNDAQGVSNRLPPS